MVAHLEVQMVAHLVVLMEVQTEVQRVAHLVVLMEAQTEDYHSPPLIVMLYQEAWKVVMMVVMKQALRLEVR